MWKICTDKEKFTKIWRIVTVHNLLQSISSDSFFAFDYRFHYDTILFFLFSTIKTIQDKKFNNTIVTYVTTMKVMTKTITTIVTKNGQI